MIRVEKEKKGRGNGRYHEWKKGGGRWGRGKVENERKDSTHCIEDPIYIFPEMKLRGLGPNFHIHVSVSDLYIPRM